MDNRQTQPHGASARPLGPGDPSAIGPYRLESKLGEGGMGAVYLGRREGGPQVAVKVVRGELADDPAFLARFRDEVTNAERVASFCTAQVLDHGQEDGRAYMVTEYIEGPSLLNHVSEQGALSPGMLNGVAVGVAAALLAIHSAGLVHRDLKPGNVLLSISGPRVIDFGIARALDLAAGHTRTGQVIGSPGWIAPEQILNQPITPAVDVFAWGCLVAFAGTGRNPFGVGTFQVMAARVVHADPEIGPLPEPLAGLVRRALDKDPANRPTAQELLLSLAGGGGEAAVTTTLHEEWPEGLAEQGTTVDGRTPVRHVPPVPDPAPVASSPMAGPSGPAPAGPAQGPPARAPQPGPPDGPPAPAPPPGPPPGPRTAASHHGYAPTSPALGHPFVPPPGPAELEPPPPPVHRPRKVGRGAVLGTVAAVTLLTVGVALAFTVFQPDDRSGESGSGGPSASGLPADPLLARMDIPPGWGKECHARIGRLTPRDTDARAEEILRGEGCDVLPQWSPTRDRIAFTRWDGGDTSEVWVMKANGRGARKAGEGIVPRSRVAWSPDGEFLAAMVRVDGVPQIHVGNVATGETRQITHDAVPKDDPTWSRDGKIAFWSKRDGVQQIFCLDPEAPDRPWERLTSPAVAPDGANDPVWSPDGKRLAFTRMTGDISVINADGGGHRRLTEGGDHDMDPTWSPDGTWLAFVRGPVSTPQIWAMPVDAAAQPRAVGPLSVGHPDWS
ncbi:protein kinase domain-containing protein [Thermomonospora umbrina]|uniref:Serine/threonine protein kinase n=1 Tax=Thermomonospora umbrina TaxID=111806 RepID=A0A3D9SFY2_9ACTN|nr:protein kinase [Thermomonospora umbrina]REE94838.1 serine/threonine protein kinase [Thermomonospora umbrina]